MSGNIEEEKESSKGIPLDLARSQITSLRTVEGKPLVMTNQSLRGMRVLTQGISNTNTPSLGGPTIITTNLVSQAVLKSDTGSNSRPQIASIIGSSAPQSSIRPTQITLASAPLIAQSTVGTTYHVPRGPAVVANLAAPRNNVTSVRTPMVVTAQNSQPHGFVRPPRIPSPAQGTAWLTNSSNVSQIKGTPTVLSSPVRGAMVTGKPQIIGKTQSQNVPTIRPGAILQNAITLGQTGQAQVTTARLTVPVNVTHSNTRLVAPQATVLTSGLRISNVSSQQPTVLSTTPARVVSTQPNVTIGRLSVAASPTVSTANLLGQARISTLNLHSLVAVANTSHAKSIQTQGTKVITQNSQGTIHFTSLTSSNKTSASVVSTATRTSPSTTSVTSTSTIPTTTTVATYSLAGGTYFYDNSASGYPVNRNFNQQSSTYESLAQNSPQLRSNINTQVHGIVANRFNPIMVVEQNRGQQLQQFPLGLANEQSLQEHQPQQQMPTKITSSPRPSILRKRDHEGSPLKTAKNLTPVLSSLPIHQQQQAPLSPPLRPDSRGNGHSSGGSTTISATSSPGLVEVNDDSNYAPLNHKEEEETKPPMEMSPRKKPRKQQLTGNDIDENNDDMQFISDNTVKKENDDSDINHSDEPKDGAPEAGQITTVRKPASASLLNSYRQNWKATHNHYLRHSDVRPKDERRPTIMDLANQYRVQEKVNGWKIHHLTTQMEDLAEQEQSVYDQLMELLKCTESEESYKQFDKEVNRINELIKGNLQRIKIINDGMIEAKSQIMKIFDHKVHVTDIINRCASKRNFKKREKS